MITGIRQRTPEWLAARREGVTGTDIPAILGLSPYRSEGDVAREKLGETVEHDARTQRRLRIGTALEDVIRAEDEVEHGHRLRRVNRLIRSRDIPWAMASLDFERRDGTIVEAKSSRDRRWDHGLPPDVEAQVQWQMGVSGREHAHVAALRYGSDLECYDLDAKPDDFAGMIIVAADFRRRLAEGGPFSETRESISRAWPADNGIEMIADETLEALVAEYLAAKAAAKSADEAEEAAALAIKSRMGPAAKLTGAGWHATWKQNRPSRTTDWDLVASAYRRLIEELVNEAEALAQVDAIESLYTREVPGKRPLVVRRDKETR
jgi:putative phage-type endonuclease